MAAAVQILAAVVLVLLMVAVGLAVSADSLRRLAASPARIGGLLVGQLLLVPMVGVLLAMVADGFGAGPRVVTWILILAACPGGALSNAIVLYGRGDVTLSVAMTAASSLLASITMPIVLVSCRSAGLLPELSVPGPRLFVATLLLLLVPCLAGMAIASRCPAKVPVLARFAGRTGSGLLLIALGMSIWHHRETVLETWWLATSAAVGFVGLGGGLGGAMAAVARLDSSGRFAVATEFGVRNVAVALAVATLSTDAGGFAGFGAVYLFVEVLLLGGIAHLRRRRVPATVAAGEP